MPDVPEMERSNGLQAQKPATQPPHAGAYQGRNGDQPVVGIDRVNLPEVPPALAGLRRLRDTRHAVDVGGVILAHVRNNPMSMRELSRANDVKLSASTLRRAVSIFRLSENWPELLESTHLGLSHVYAVLDLPRRWQTQLLRRAEKLGWTARRTRGEAVQLRPPRRASGMRRVKTTARTLARKLNALSQLTAEEESIPSNSSERDVLLHALDEARLNLDAIEAALFGRKG